MAGVGAPLDVRAQFAAIAQLRFNIIVNSLRTMTGKTEMVFRVFGMVMLALAGLGAAIGFGSAAYLFVSTASSIEWLAILLWVVFVAWQLIPVFTAALTSATDSSMLLRFPLSFPGFVAVQLAYGSADVVTTVGCLATFGMMVGAGIAKPALLPWTSLNLLFFAVGNILLARAIFAWIERWLAQRRTRELMGVLLLLVALSFQLIGPALRSMHGGPTNKIAGLARRALPVERLAPPGMAARSMALAQNGRYGSAAGYLGLILVYESGIAWILLIRLRAQYRGENLSEAPARRDASPRSALKERSSSSRFVSGPVSAIVEKELNYLRRSPPILFALVAPVFMLIVIGSSRGGSILHSGSAFLFPIGAAYALLSLINLAYNCFATDAGGVQIYFTAPVPMRKVVLAKNLSASALIAVQIGILWLVLSSFFRRPPADVFCTTLAWLLFAAPLNFAIGNVVSIYFPKKIDLAKFGRQKGSAASGLIGFGVQAVSVGIGAPILALARFYGSPWLAVPILAVCAAASVALYMMILNRVGQMVVDRREALVGELSRA